MNSRVGGALNVGSVAGDEGMGKGGWAGRWSRADAFSSTVVLHRVIFCFVTTVSCHKFVVRTKG